MMYKSQFPNSYRMYAPEYAAMILAHEQHKPGNKQRMNERFQIEYVRPDGSVVPAYNFYLKAVLEGRVSHDAKTGEYIIEMEA